MEAHLRANQTYYVQVLNSSSAVTFLTVEEARQSNRETAEAISFDQVYDFDLTSVFDNFYYKFNVAESTQMSVNFTEGLVTLEDQEGNIVTTFESDQEDHVFIPVETGTYYIKLNYDPNDTIATKMARSNIRSIQPFSSLKKGQVSIKVLTPSPMFKAINALPGHEEPVQFTWKFTEDHFSTTISIFEKNTGNPGRLVYQEKMYMLAGNTNLRFTWDGKVNQPNIGEYAQNGRYLVRIVADDAPAFPYEAYVTVYNEGEQDIELDADELIARYNATISSSDISKVQGYLKQMMFYDGDITGIYDEHFLMSVMAYEHVINKWGTHVALDIYRGLDFLEEKGEINSRLLRYAYADASLGRDKYGEIYEYFYNGDSYILVFVGEGILDKIVRGVLYGIRGTKLGIKRGELISKSGNLSKNFVGHLTKGHRFDLFKNQIPFLLKKKTRAQVENQLAGITFFNKNWKEDEIIEVMENLYEVAKKNGFKTGKYETIFKGEKVIMAVRDGVPQTAYGPHRYTLEDFGF